MSTYYRLLIGVGNESLLKNKGWNALYTYVLLHENSTNEIVESKLPDFLAKFYASYNTWEDILASTAFRLQPITQIHLHSNIEKEMGPNSSINYVYIFSNYCECAGFNVQNCNFVNSTIRLISRSRRWTGQDLYPSIS